MKYRGDIDGLRAVAVLGVVSYHYGLTAIAGGFVGVDVFFVISGYLITRSLIDDMSKGGWMWLPRFYDRRIRRIAPALFTVLVSTLIASAALLTPGDYQSVGESTAFSAAGLGNIYFYLNTDYFDQSADLQPLLHMWSLGVEEQFYLLWPLALASIIAATKSARDRVVLMIGLIALVSLLFAEYQMAVDPKASFYLPFSRAWELSVGCVLAFAPTITSKTTSNIVSTVAIALLGFALFTTSTTPFPGIAALPAVMGAALAVWPKQPGDMASILDNKPMRQIGLWSYSLYLWHWPILVLYRHYNGGAMPGPLEAMLLAGFGLLAAYMTWKYVESIRYVKLGVLKTISVGMAGTLVVAAAGLVVDKTDGLVERFPPEKRDIATLQSMWTWECGATEQLGTLARKSCIFGEPWETATTRGIIWGDSHAGHMAPLVEAILPPGTAVALVQPCPPALGGTVRRVHPELPEYVKLCEDIQRDVTALMGTQKVDWVMLAAAWRGLAPLVTKDESLEEHIEGLSLVAFGLEETIRKIPPNVRVIIASQVPGLEGPLTPCELGLFRSNCDQIAKSMFTLYKSQTAPIDEMIMKVALNTGSDFFVPGRNLCALGRCVSKVDGEIIYRDMNHIRRNLPLNVRIKLARLVGLEPGLLTALPTGTGL